MRTSSKAFFLVVCVGLLTTSACKTPSPKLPGKPIENTQLLRKAIESTQLLPYKTLGDITGLKNESPMIEVHLRNGNKSERAIMLIDTGHYYSVINKRLAQRLALTTTSHTSTRNRKKIPVAPIEGIRIGAEEFIGDVAIYERSWLKFGRREIDGIIGSDILCTTVTVIEGRRKKITLTTRKLPAPTNSDSVVDANFLPNQSGDFFVNVLINGTKRRLSVDTGASATFINSDAMPFKSLVKGAPCYFAVNEGDKMKVCESLVDLQISELKLPRLAVGVLPHPIGTTDGSLGMDVLSKGKVHLDFQNKKIYFEP